MRLRRTAGAIVGGAILVLVAVVSSGCDGDSAESGLPPATPTGTASATATAGPETTPTASPSTTPTETATLVPTVVTSPSATSIAGTPLSVADIAERAGVSVVQVNIYSAGTRDRIGTGSGWAFDDADHFVTNDHVVSATDLFGSSTEITITTSEGRELPVEIVGRDTRSDLAILLVDGADLPPLPLGDLSQTRIGDPVVAIGYALNLGDSPSVTTGVISARERRIQETSAIFGALQTDAAINPGNSGGPLLNLRGEVVGVNTAIDTGGQGIGFAVSVDTVRVVARELIEKGRVERGFIGIEFEELTPAMAKELGLPFQRGVRVTNVLAGFPAEAVGLRVGDALVSVAGHRIEYTSHLALALVGHPPGDTIAIELYRDGETRTVDLTLAEIPGGG